MDLIIERLTDALISGATYSLMAVAFSLAYGAGRPLIFVGCASYLLGIAVTAGVVWTARPYGFVSEPVLLSVLLLIELASAIGVGYFVGLRPQQVRSLVRNGDADRLHWPPDARGRSVADRRPNATTAWSVSISYRNSRDRHRFSQTRSRPYRRCRYHRHSASAAEWLVWSCAASDDGRQPNGRAAWARCPEIC